MLKATRRAQGRPQAAQMTQDHIGLGGTGAWLSASGGGRHNGGRNGTVVKEGQVGQEVPLLKRQTQALTPWVCA
jgi:hypothetical protein